MTLKPPLERLAARSVEAPHLVKGLPLPCWVQTTGLDRYGYGQIREGRRGTPLHRSHRLAYRELIGDIPDGLDGDHLCRRRACWNPFHLDPVTRRINTLRGDASRLRRQHAAAQTHCHRKHAFDQDNTRIRRDGSRVCRACDRDRKTPKAA